MDKMLECLHKIHFTSFLTVTAKTERLKVPSLSKKLHLPALRLQSIGLWSKPSLCLRVRVGFPSALWCSPTCSSADVEGLRACELALRRMALHQVSCLGPETKNSQCIPSMNEASISHPINALSWNVIEMKFYLYAVFCNFKQRAWLTHPFKWI